MGFEKQLSEFIGLCRDDPIEDEWILSKFCDNGIENLSPEQAFKGIDHTVTVQGAIVNLNCRPEGAEVLSRG